MNTLPDFHDENKQSSVLLIEPKDEFLSWAQSYLSSQEPAQELDDVFFPEENGVWKVPPIGSFTSESEFYQFIDEMKPKLLEMELQRITLETVAFSEPIDSATFDKYFDIRVRDTLNDIRSLCPPTEQ